jgi:hypothetical protein
MSDATLTLLLWCATAVLLGWKWIPALIAGLGGTRFAAGGSDDPTVLTPSDSEPTFAALHRQITALGYEPLGPAWMRITCHGSDWRYDVPLRVFYSRAKQTYALVQQQPPPMDVWWLTMFATCWTDGGLLLTNNAVNEPTEDGDYVVQGMESNDLAAIEQLHFATRDRMRSEGKRPETDGSLETLLTAIRKHSGSAARFVSLKLGQTYLTTHGMIHAFLSVPVVYVNGFTHWSLPLVNLALGGLIAGGEHIAKRRAGRMMKAQADALAATGRP